jgi:hypothetical protein
MEENVECFETAPTIPNGERRDSESSRGGGTARAAVDGDGGDDNGKQGQTLMGKGR